MCSGSKENTDSNAGEAMATVLGRLQKVEEVNKGQTDSEHHSANNSYQLQGHQEETAKKMGAQEEGRRSAIELLQPEGVGKLRTEGVGHPAREKHGSGTQIMEGIDHPHWR